MSKNRIKKILALVPALLILPIFSFAQTADEPNPPGLGKEFQGRWEIADHVCSSGAIPRDDFRLGKDQSTLSFSGSDYDGHLRIGNCHMWVSGKAEFQRGTLRAYDLASGSNCGVRPTLPTVTSAVEISADTLKVFTGPVGPGSSCPRGDVLIDVYHRVNQCK